MSNPDSDVRSAGRLWHTGWHRGAHLALLLLAFGFLTYNAVAQSPTMDEQNHIARGYALLRTGDPRLSLEHPPAINLLEALPLGGGVALPLDDPAWATGNWYRFADLFFWERNSLQGRMVFLARMPVIGMTLLLGALAARWGRELGGAGAGLLALAITLLDPNILAHGSLATTDLGITWTVVLAAYILWRTSGILRAQETWTAGSVLIRTLVAGLVLGFMLASKTSALLFWGVLGVLWVIDARGTGGWARWWRRAGSRALFYVGASLTALVFVWATYAFEMAPLTEGGLAVPMGTYWRGVRTVFDNFEGGRPAYLLGKTRLDGWLLYFPIAFAVKTPLPTLALLVGAFVIQLLDRTPHTLGARRATAYLLVPVACYWGAAFGSDLNLGYRHLLPTLPLLFIWIAQRWRRARGAAWAWTATGLVVALSLVTVWIAPHYLAYFNAIGGGPTQGWQILADSNIDWGQDLKALAAYLEREAPDEIVKLSWFGSSPPGVYGIRYEPLPGLPHHFDMWFQPPTFNEVQPEPGIYVISVSNLVELPLMDKHFFAYFRERPPDVRIGYSVYIYYVEET